MKTIDSNHLFDRGQYKGTMSDFHNGLHILGGIIAARHRARPGRTGSLVAAMGSWSCGPGTLSPRGHC